MMNDDSFGSSSLTHCFLANMPLNFSLIPISLNFSDITEPAFAMPSPALPATTLAPSTPRSRNSSAFLGGSLPSKI